MITRRAVVARIAALGATVLTRPALAADAAPAPLTRAIPRTGERLPAVGLGTAQVFDSDNAKTRDSAAAVVHALVEHGGRLVDTASSYGDAERVLGGVLASGNLRDRIFIATKLETSEQSELDRSLARLGTATLDLLQLHNVRDPQQSLAAFKAWQARGVCRYVGITSTSHRAFDAIASVLERERPDFVQIDYSIDDREAEKRILPLAGDLKAGVLTALPFGRGRLFRAVRDRALPDWAKDFADSWAQFFLKYLLADPRVTAVIPGTRDPAHMIDNLGALRGRLPDPELRRRMAAFIDAL